jgi:hypothetical protein
MFGLASKSKSASHFCRGNPAFCTRRMVERRSRSSTWPAAARQVPEVGQTPDVLIHADHLHTVEPVLVVD